MNDREQHRRFLDAYYGRVRRLYDPTRKFFLFGRDGVLAALLEEPWSALVEIGPGTGRNLAVLRRARPSATYGGVDASDAMLELARRRAPWAHLAHGFAEDADYADLLGRRPDRVLFSYSLSMVQEPARALDNALRSVAPGGSVVVVDFGDMSALSLLARPMRAFLRSFHVTAPDVEPLRERGATLRWGPGRYYVAATLRGPA